MVVVVKDPQLSLGARSQLGRRWGWNVVGHVSPFGNNFPGMKATVSVNKCRRYYLSDLKYPAFWYPRVAERHFMTL